MNIKKEEKLHFSFLLRSEKEPEKDLRFKRIARSSLMYRFNPLSFSSCQAFQISDSSQNNFSYGTKKKGKQKNFPIFYANFANDTIIKKEIVA